MISSSVHTRTQTQDFDMIPQLGLGERQQRRRKEHGLIVRMRNHQTYPFVVQLGKRAGEGRAGRGGERPEDREGHRSDESDGDPRVGA